MSQGFVVTPSLEDMAALRDNPQSLPTERLRSIVAMRKMLLDVLHRDNPGQTFRCELHDWAAAELERRQ